MTVSQKWDKRAGQWHDHVISAAAFGKVLDRILDLSQPQPSDACVDLSRHRVRDDSPGPAGGLGARSRHLARYDRGPCRADGRCGAREPIDRGGPLAVGGARRRSLASGRQLRPTRPSKGLQVTSKPAPPSAAPDMLGRVLLPLRAFLGFTFCFAGLQKLANPRFFDAAAPASIQAQLAAAARRSPVRELISPLTHVAVALGILIAFGELAVGVGTLLGLRARLAAAGGLVLSVMLFLTVSFHSVPYYTGADIVFAFAWTPLLLAGSGSVLSLDAAVEDGPAVRRPLPGGRRGDPGPPPEVHRREVVLGGMTTAAVAAASLVIGGLAAGLGRLAGGTAGTGGPSSLPSAIGPVPAATAGTSNSSGPKPGKVPSGTAIGPAADVPARRPPHSRIRPRVIRRS